MFKCGKHTSLYQTASREVSMIQGGQ